MSVWTHDEGFSPPFAYAVAVLLAAFALAARIAGHDWVGDRPPLMILTVPIILSAYWGGLGPGLMATAISALGAAYYLLPPIGRFAVADPASLWQVSVLGLSGTLMSVVCERMRAAGREARGRR